MAHPIRDILDQALQTDSGLSLAFTSKSEAHSWRMSAYALRRREAAQSKAIYPAAHPSHGTSPYDSLIIRFHDPATITIAPSPPPPTVTVLLAPGEKPVKPKPGSSTPGSST